MTAILLPVNWTTDAPALFGSVPGGVLAFGTSSGAVDDTYYRLLTSSGFTDGLLSAFTFGVTDMTNSRSEATGIGSSGFAGSRTDFDAGKNSAEQGVVITRSLGMTLNPTGGNFAPITCDGEWQSNAFGTPLANGRAAMLAFGAACSAKVGGVNLNATTGNQSLTGLGFEPQIVIFVGCTTYVPSTQDALQSESTNFMLGAADGDGNQWAMTLGSSYDLSRLSWFRDDACILHIPSYFPAAPHDETTVEQVAEFVSMDSDGFTFNLTSAGHDNTGNAMHVSYLAIGDITGSVKVGVGLQGDTSLTAGFRPDAVLFASSQDIDASVSDHAHGCVGATDGILQKSAWLGSESIPLPTGLPTPWSYWSSDRVMRFTDSTEALLADATATLTATGATLDWPNDDTVARQFGWVALQIDDVLGGCPVATTGAGSGICTTAEIEGSVDSDADGTWYFEWGATTSYGNTSTGGSVSAGVTSVSDTISGLSPGFTYHYRLVFVTSLTTVAGADESFVEGDCPPTANMTVNCEFGV